MRGRANKNIIKKEENIVRKRYETPVLRAICVSAEDVISTSLNDKMKADSYDLTQLTDGLDKEEFGQ